MAALASVNLPAMGQVATPTYDRGAASVGILHFGFGNFHRSHEAMYIDRLMESGQGLDWGICGVGVLPQDVAMRDVMHAQDCLYTLVIRHADGSLEPRVVGSVLEYLFGPDDPEAVYARLMDPSVRIVSLTVTEGGYLKNAATGEFDPTSAAVVHDLSNPQQPQTAFAYLVEALRRRRTAGLEPFTVLSCDNLQGNGDIARRAITGFARLVDPDLGEWIDANVSFPNCMVDRITPVTTDADRAAVADDFGIEDQWPVPAEPFVQWIVEDHFTAGRPPLELVGVQFVEDVKPYELMKLRLLNASHMGVAYLGAPLGYAFVDEVLRDDLIRVFLERYMTQEAAPTLGDLPGIDLDGYMAAVIERFSNPKMRDTLKRLTTDGANRMTTFTLPTIRANLAAGRDVPLGALVVAAWAQFWVQIANGELWPAEVPEDAHAAEMMRAALAQDESPTAFIEQQGLFGEMSSNEVFREEFLKARSSLADRGVHATLRQALATV